MCRPDRRRTMLRSIQRRGDRQSVRRHGAGRNGKSGSQHDAAGEFAIAVRSAAELRRSPTLCRHAYSRMRRVTPFWTRTEIGNLSVRRTSTASSITCRCRRGTWAPIRCSMPRRLTMCRACRSPNSIGTDIAGACRSAVLLPAAVQQGFARARSGPRESQHGDRAADTAATSTAAAQIWSEVFDGIMHRDPRRKPVGVASWATSVRRGAMSCSVAAAMRKSNAGARSGRRIGSVDKIADDVPPDALQFGLNPNFPTFFANPFRSPDAGDLVPLQRMVHYGVDASWMRRHHFNRGGRWQLGQDQCATTIGDWHFDRRHARSRLRRRRSRRRCRNTGSCCRSPRRSFQRRRVAFRCSASRLTRRTTTASATRTCTTSR